MIFVNSQGHVTAPNGRVLGKIISETYYTLRAPQHFFVKYNGFGISEDVTDELLERGTRFVVFEYQSKKGLVAYRTTLGTIIREGIKHVDSTFGKTDHQLVTPITLMQEIGIPLKIGAQVV